MKFEGSKEINVNSSLIWGFLTNPTNLAECLPDAKSYEVVDDKTIKAKLKIGISFIKETFDSTIIYSEVMLDSKYMKITIDAKGKANSATINIEVNIEDIGSITKLHWMVDAFMTGKLVSVGQRYILKVADRLIEQAFTCMISKLTST